MKILVTGGTGFLGASLIPLLLVRGHQVVVAVRKISPLIPSSVVQRLVAPISRETDWDTALDGVEAVVHLAALAHVTSEKISLAEEDLFQEVNVRGTERLAQWALKKGVGKFILLSSLHAVASHSKVAIDETTPPSPDSPYARSKMRAEEVVRETFRDSSVKWTILRPPLVYGPGQKANMEKLVRLVASGVPLPLGALQNRRSLIGVQNLSDLIVTCLVDPRAEGETFVCSDGDPLSTSDLIDQIARALSCRVLLFRVPPFLLRGFRCLPGLQSLGKLTESLYVDDRRVKATLGWRAPFTLEEGLKEMVKARGRRPDDSGRQEAVRC